MKNELARRSFILRACPANVCNRESCLTPEIKAVRSKTIRRNDGTDMLESGTPLLLELRIHIHFSPKIEKLPCFIFILFLRSSISFLRFYLSFDRTIESNCLEGKELNVDVHDW